MCPRPPNVKRHIAEICAEQETLVSPKIFGEVKAEQSITHPKFYIGEEVEEAYPYEDSYFKPEFDLSDRDIEQRLSFLFNKFCLKKEAKQCSPTETLITKTDKAPVGKNEEGVVSKPRSPSVLKMPNSPPSELKKSVRFADSIGLDLTHVKLFSSNTDIDDFYDINDHLSAPVTNSFSSWAAVAGIDHDQRQLFIRSPLHTKEKVKEIVESENVCIESITCKGMLLSGQIQVKNIAYEKQVRLRYTLDNWRTYSEIPCAFSFSKVADNREIFSFSLCLPRDLPLGGRIKMCVQYSAAGQTFWDNNSGRNYAIDCCAVVPTYQHDEFEVWSTCSAKTF